MLSETYRLYFDETLAFVRTFVYKIEVQNDLLNERLETLGYSVSEDATSWKYNLNLNGSYHDTDIEMTVISSDTKEEISFDKVTLQSHPRTLLAHQRGTEEYAALVARYPKQETLINGIVNPIAMDTIIAAKEFELMQYNTSYLQDNERTLMRRVQDWIDIYVKRWWVPGLAYTNELYPADFVAKLNMLLVGVVATIRLELSQSPEVDEFHLWSYLGDHYGLDRYKANLSLSQALWLFRNIEYIRRNAGTIENLEDMMENLAAPAGLSLKKLDFLQLDNNLLTTRARSSSYSLTDYDATAVSLASGDTLSVSSAAGLLSDIAPYNAEDADIDLAYLKRKGATLKENWLPTKILRADENGTLLSQETSNMPTKVNYWAYLSYLGLYTANLTIDSASLGTLYLTPKDAFILYMYACNASYGNLLTTVPTIKVQGVTPVTAPTVSEVYPLVDSTLLGYSDVTAILDTAVTLEELTSLDAFTAFIDNVIELDAIRDMIEEGYTHPDVRSMMRDVSDSLVTDVTIQIETDTPVYSEWLYNQGVDAEAYSEDEWYEIATAITTAAIDYSGNTTSVGRKQRAMIEIMNMLTSYDVRILEGSSSERKRIITMPSERFFDINIDTTVSDFIQYNPTVPQTDAGNIGIVVGADVEFSSSTDLPEEEAWVAAVDYGTDTIEVNLSEAVGGLVDAYTEQFTDLS